MYGQLVTGSVMPLAASRAQSHLKVQHVQRSNMRSALSVSVSISVSLSLCLCLSLWCLGVSFLRNFHCLFC